MGRRGVHHMQQEGGAACLLEGGAEGGHQFVREFADEPHGVGQQHPAAVRQGQPPEGGVQGRKELIGLEYPRLGQAVEQGGLARVRVADQ